MLIFEAPICVYTLSIRLRKIRLPLMVKIKKDRREREKERSLAFSWKYLDITMFSLQLMTKDKPGFELGGWMLWECCWSHLTVFSTPTIVSPRLKKEKFGQFIVIASLRKVTCRRECRAHYSVMAAQPVKVREIYHGRMASRDFSWSQIKSRWYFKRTHQLFCSWFDNTVITMEPTGVAWEKKVWMLVIKLWA